MVTHADHVVDAWRAASEPAISIRSVSWPHLATFGANCRNIYRESSGSDEPSELARTAYSILIDIKSAPVAPSNPATNIDELIRRCEAFADSHPDHSLSDPLLRLACAGLDLLSERSPLLDAVLDELSNYGLHEDGQPQAVIAVSRPDLAKPTEEFLNEEGFSAAVCTPSQLKLNSRHYMGVIIVGKIATTYKSPWKDQQTAAREIGWLVTAPPADEVRLINVCGDNLDLNDGWLLPGDRHPHLQAVISVTPPEPIMSIDIPDLFLSPHPTKVTPYSSAGIDAHLVHLFSGRVVYFADDDGPTPQRVVIGETTVSLEDCDVKRLRKGYLLLLQARESDSDEIEKRAANILQSQYGWVQEDLEQAEQARRQLKHALRKALDQVGKEELHQRLSGSGLSDGYSHHLLDKPLGSRYICPQKKGFAPLLKAINASDLCIHEDRLQTLKTAHQQAGKEIKKELNQLLETDYGWLDNINAEGFAKVDGGSLGTLLVEVVAAEVDSIKYSVPMTHLGRDIEADTGQPYLPTSGDEK